MVIFRSYVSLPEGMVYGSYISVRRDPRSSDCVQYMVVAEIYDLW